MLLVPRRITFFVFGLVVGLAAGGAVGYNAGRGAPLFSNPFAKERSLGEKIRRAGGRVFEETGSAVERGGRKLKRIFDR